MELEGPHFAAQIRASRAETFVQVEIEVASITQPEPSTRMPGLETDRKLLLVPSDAAYSSTVSYLEKVKGDIPLTAVGHPDSSGIMTRGYDTRNGGRIVLGQECASNPSRLFRAAAGSARLCTQTPFSAEAPAKITLIWPPMPTATEDGDSWHLMEQAFAAFCDFSVSGAPTGHEICYVDEKERAAPWSCHTNVTLHNSPDYADKMATTLAWLDSLDGWAVELATVLRAEPHPRLLLAAMFCRSTGWALRAVPSVKGFLQTRYGGLAHQPAKPVVHLDLWLPWDGTPAAPVYAMSPTEPCTVRMASGFGGPARLRFTATSPGTSTIFLWGGANEPLRVIHDMAARDGPGAEVPMAALASPPTGLLERLKLMQEHCRPALAVMVDAGAAFQTDATNAALQGQAFAAYQTLMEQLRELTAPTPDPHVLLLRLQAWFMEQVRKHQSALMPPLPVSPVPKKPRLYPGATMLAAPSMGALSSWGQQPSWGL
jgi:hypothetical protein